MIYDNSNVVCETTKFKVRYLGEKTFCTPNKKLCKNDICYAEIEKFKKETDNFISVSIQFSIIIGGFKYFVTSLFEENDFKLLKDFEKVDDSETPNGSYVDKNDYATISRVKGGIE